MTTTNQIVTTSTNEIAISSTEVFAKFLAQYGLPSDNIIANTVEREYVRNGLPTLIAGLSSDIKKDARYLSKFYAASAIGLFDAALNYVWNEVVLNLRKRAVLYGIDLFFDAAVGGKSRESFNEERDLEGIKDKTLLDSCHKLELISDIVYKKLENISTMRNEIAASHPNVESIGGFELLGWLQTCVKDVLQDQPSESAIHVRKLIENLKNSEEIVGKTEVEHFGKALESLALPHVHSILITFFGMFVNTGTKQTLRKNIAILLPKIWQRADEKVKYGLGINMHTYRVNLQTDKIKLGSDFLQIVDGLRYESQDERVYALSNLAERLEETHCGWDNFYHEPPVMREILQYIKKSNDIPEIIKPKLVTVVMRCRIGRGLSYCNGVSPAGLSLYDRFLGLLDDSSIIECIIALWTNEIKVKLDNPVCLQQLRSVFDLLLSIAVNNELQNLITFLLKNIDKLNTLKNNKQFIEMSSQFFTWKK